MRLALVTLLFATACRGDGRAPSRGPEPKPTQLGGSGSASVAPATTPPPGTDELVAPPAEIAAKVALKEIAHGLKRPVLLTSAPNDPRRRLFIVEQPGAIKILEGGKVSDKAFFTIDGLSHGNEEGLLGLAFHPRFAETKKLYVNYTAKDMSTHIVEYKVSASDPDVVDTASRREIIRIEQPYSNHNGGHLAFGPDGKLYAGMGDGGAANDPHGNGQNEKALLAKMLRFDVDGDAKPEIVHIGLRNPWRFSFDSKTGDLFIGDVGQNLFEYVHAVAGTDTSRKNFGWNIVEGTHCFDPDSGTSKQTCDRTGLTPPLVEYPHEQGCSITGGYVYRGKALPALAGRYFYADYCTGLLRSFVWVSGAVREHWDWKPAIDKQGVITQVSSFGVDHDGELYIVELTGSIYQLVPSS
ncbi:MAG TPA: PQQ-dependent sugar dehydrogenase [Kofleriaceae bacterium]|nr:PQQ-dependent sugar dehydrogenase [Kofleriaceae bacterium]